MAAFAKESRRESWDVMGIVSHLQLCWILLWKQTKLTETLTACPRSQQHVPFFSFTHPIREGCLCGALLVNDRIPDKDDSQAAGLILAAKRCCDKCSHSVRRLIMALHPSGLCQMMPFPSHWWYAWFAASVSDFSSSVSVTNSHLVF